MVDDAARGYSARSGGHPSGRALETRAAQVHQLYAQARTGLIGAFVGAAVLVVALREIIAHELLFGWFALIVLVHVHRYRLVSSYFRAGPHAVDAERWGKRLAIGVIAGAVLWGAAAIAFFSSQSLLHQFLLSLFLAGVSCGAAAVYWPLREVCLPAILIELLPLSGRFLYEGDEVHVIIGIVILMFAVVLVVMGNSANVRFVETLKLRFEKADLADSLETARRELERRVEERTAALVQANEDLRYEIAERRAAQAALAESEEKYRALIQTSGEGICVVQDGLLRFVNPKTAQVLGLTEQEVLGSEYTRFIHPDDRAEVEARYAAQLGGEVLPRRFTFRAVSHQGDTKWLEGDTALFQWDGRPAVLLFVADVTDRRQNEEALRESEATLKSILRAAHMGVGVVKGRRTIAWTNEALCRMTGYSAEELVGQSARLLYESEEEYDRVGRLKYPQIEARGWGAVETCWRRKDGEIIEIFLSSAAVEPGDLEPGSYLRHWTSPIVNERSVRCATRKRSTVFSLTSRRSEFSPSMPRDGFSKRTGNWWKSSDRPELKRPRKSTCSLSRFSWRPGSLKSFDVVYRKGCRSLQNGLTSASGANRCIFECC